MYPDVSESVIPTEAKRSGGILCLPLSSYGKATTRFLDSRRKASLARNDVHLSGYSMHLWFQSSPAVQIPGAPTLKPLGANNKHR